MTKFIELGDRFENITGEINRVIKISKTALILTTVDESTEEIKKFRYYDASGHYIQEGTNTKTLGNLIEE